jgi:hypothetical protein
LKTLIETVATVHVMDSDSSKRFLVFGFLAAAVRRNPKFSPQTERYLLAIATIATIKSSTRTAKVKKRQGSERRSKKLLQEACRGKLGFRLNEHAADVDTQLFLALQLGVLSGLPGSFVYGSSGTVYGARCHGIVDMARIITRGV